MVPVEKNKEYIVDIIDISSDGNGICRIDGFTVFVPLTVEGDKARILIVKIRSGFAYGKLLEIINSSEYRCEEVCGSFRRCGGCQLIHVDYQKQLEVKSDIVNNALSRIGKISDYDFDGIKGMDNPFEYRNKMIFPIGYDKNKNICFGFYANRSHDIIPLENCMLGGVECTQIASEVVGFAKRHNISAYDENTHSGVLRRVFIRKSFSQNKYMVVISANASSIPHSDELVKMLRDNHKNIVSVILNINKKRTNLVLGEKNIVLFGVEKLNDTVCGNEFEISPYSFFQVNPIQTEVLYSTAIEYANISSNDSVLDIYCGIGTISLACAKSAKSVTGIEIVSEAIEDAKVNAKNNGIDNARFYTADASELVPKLIEDGNKYDVVILDPPRKGSDENVIGAIAKANPKRVVYVSCNPSTLARDLSVFEKLGYKTKRVTAVDMFPHTVHVETIALLQRQDT